MKNLESLKKIIESQSEDRHLNELEHIAHVLLEAEKHHKREEDVLFPKLEHYHGADFCPTKVMRLEHEELRKRKKALAEAIKKKDYNNLRENAIYIATNLSEHISKEDNILYEMAKEVLTKSDWTQIRKEFDKIGYCCFSPKKR